MGVGAAEILPKVTLNIGMMTGGLKVNMIPGVCWVEADIRLPLGVDKETIMKEVNAIASRYPDVAIEEIGFNPPSYCDPYGEMVEILQKNKSEISGASRRYRSSASVQPTPDFGATEIFRPT